MKGNDNKEYKSVPDKRGVYTWKPLTKTVKRKGKEYEIIDNGGVPFTVVVNGKTAEIYKKDSKEIIMGTPFLKIFIGDNDLKDPRSAPKGQDPGNSILIKVGPHKYIYVGSEIYSFLTDDPIKAYYSPLGNSAVPYPYAVGEKSVYFMLDRIAVPVEQIDLKEDGYSQFYMKGNELKKSPFKVTIIKRRQF